jgi:ParB family chromosome partitioning protein
LRRFGEVRGKALPLPPKQAKALTKAEHEADELRELDELDDEQAERLDPLDAEIETLREPEYGWSDRRKARAGAILTVDSEAFGAAQPYIRPEDVKAKKPDEDEAQSGETEPTPRQGFSAALADDLTAHRTAALRAVLANRPDVALAELAYGLALPMVYVVGESPLALHVVTPALRAEGIEDSKAMKHGDGQHIAWQGRLWRQ